MKLLTLAMAATVCGLVSAVPGGSTSLGKPRRRCSRRPHSLATSKTRHHHSSSATTSTTVIINTTSTSTQSTTATSVSTTAPPDTTTTTAPPDTTTTAPPDTTTTAPPDTTTAPPETTTTTTAPPPVQTCELGTGFGYRAPVGGVVQAPQLDTSAATTCNRWGWYTTPTEADLVSGVTGQLLVGAGNNNINAATNVGTYLATINTQGVMVTYQLSPGYALTEVHVDLRCLPILSCAPGGYTYVQDSIPALPLWVTDALPYPTCSGGSVAYLIVHASVVKLTTGACSD
jgi:hypothetical protein